VSVCRAGLGRCSKTSKAGSRVARIVPLSWSWNVVHDAVVGAASTGAVVAQHLRRRPVVQLHQITLGAAAVGPGVAEVVPEPVGQACTPHWPGQDNDNAAVGCRS
jgi:hypothetical protein